MPNYFEELYVGVIETNPLPNCPGNPGDYVVVHVTNHDRKFISGISFDYLAGYMAGALFRKPIKAITLTNGITKEAGRDWFPKTTFSPLPETDLERLLKTARVDCTYNIEDFK